MRPYASISSWYRSNNWNDGVKDFDTFFVDWVMFVAIMWVHLSTGLSSIPNTQRSELMVEEQSLLTFACLISLSNTPVHCAEEASSHSDGWDQSQGHPLLPSRCVHLRIKSLFVEVKMARAQEHNFLVKPPQLPSDHHNLPGLCLTGQEILLLVWTPVCSELQPTKGGYRQKPDTRPKPSTILSPSVRRLTTWTWTEERLKNTHMISATCFIYSVFILFAFLFYLNSPLSSLGAKRIFRIFNIFYILNIFTHLLSCFTAGAQHFILNVI